MTIEDLRRFCRCCACEGPVGRVNLVTIRRRATWEYPRSENVLTGDGPCAVAILCDGCIEARAKVIHAVEISGGQAVYHDVASLEELGPEPTCVVDKLGRWIRCLVCGKTSWSRRDVAEKYCGWCHKSHPITATADDEELLL